MSTNDVSLEEKVEAFAELLGSEVSKKESPKKTLYKLLKKHLGRRRIVVKVLLPNDLKDRDNKPVISILYPDFEVMSSAFASIMSRKYYRGPVEIRSEYDIQGMDSVFERIVGLGLIESEKVRSSNVYGEQGVIKESQTCIY